LTQDASVVAYRSLQRSIVNALTGVTVLSLVVISFGCGDGERPHRAAKDKATYSGNSKDGGEKSAELPADFPKDVPILKNATIKVVMSQGNRTTVHLYTTSSVGDAVKFYDDAFRRQGWQIQDETKGNEMSILSARKGTSLCGVTMSKQGTGTLIRLALSQTGSHTVQ
jgi:hypothetical protein